MVASTDPYATEVGVRVLEDGGNAVDAVVAVAFALAVVNPEAGNLGGGGYLLVRTADGTAAVLDHRTTAPGRATTDMFADAGGGVSERAVIGALAAGVPGTVAGLARAHRRFGSVPWETLVEPAIGLARGFTVRRHLLRSFTPGVVAGLARFAASARIFLPDGRPPRPGDTFRQGDLARTLERIRDHGADGFYRGATAHLVVAEMERSGGLLTLDDLAGYRPVWREALRFGYRGREILSAPPSSSGGVTLAASANLLAAFPLGDLSWHGRDHVHLLAEAWRRAYADRNHYLLDPAFGDMPVDALTAAEYGAWRARDVASGAATPSDRVGPGVEAYRSASGGPGALRGRGGGPAEAEPAGPGPSPPRAPRPTDPPGEAESTTHVSVVDPAGGAASFTTTVNAWYGSKLVVEGAGFLLNNDMDDFTARPGVPNQFGLVQGEGNAIAPGKRMLSAMTPVVVLDGSGRLLLVAGTPGGATITTTVFQVLSNLVDHGMGLGRAVAAPRVHHQHRPDRIHYEAGGLTPDVVEALRALGHRVEERHEPAGDVQAVLVRPDGTLEGVADPRRGGEAAGL